MNDRTFQKALYNFVASAILTGIAAWIFFEVWSDFAIVHNQTGHLMGLGNLLMALFIYIGLFVIIGKGLHAFKIGVERKANLLASAVLTALTVDFLEIFISMAITGQFRFFWQFFRLYLLMWLGQSLILCILVIPLVNLYRKIFPPLEVVEIYSGEEGNLYQKINEVPYKYHVADFITCNVPEKEIRDAIRQYDAVLIGNNVSSNEKDRVLKICFKENKRVYFVPRISDILIRSSDNVNLWDTPVFLNKNAGISPISAAVKRFFDIVLSALALIILSPIMIGVAIAIKAEDGGPVFYKQERVTKNGKHFMILKFRSMIVDAEKDGRPHPAGEKDDRITKTGHFIRACRFDELPQLINIIKGDMSIVGPRPERYEQVEEYTKENPEFALREKVKGGLTGYAQVYGKYNTTSLDKVKLDLIYITNYSLLLDLQIIFETVKILFRKESTQGFSEEQAKNIHDKADTEEKK